MFNFTRTGQVDHATNIAKRLAERHDNVLKTRTNEFDDKINIDVVSVFNLDAEVSEENVKSIHRMTQDKRIALVAFSTEKAEKYLIVRFTLSIELSPMTREERIYQEQRDEAEQWIEDMIADIEDNIAEDELTRTEEIKKHQEIHAMMQDDFNQDIYEQDFNQDEVQEPLTSAEVEELDWISDELSRLEKLDILRRKIKQIEGNDYDLHRSLNNISQGAILSHLRTDKQRAWAERRGVD